MADLVAVEQRCVRSHALVFFLFFSSSFFCLVWNCLLRCFSPGLRVGRSFEEGGGKELETGEQLAEKKKKPLHHLLPG